ncbi:Nuclear envelope morphology protein 1 [Agyrium rufum]|nr:Nuclear envelope morphology protein 1 [Agyrium rufum]
MNSLNILSTRVIGQATPPQSPATKGARSISLSEKSRETELAPIKEKRSSSEAAKTELSGIVGERLGESVVLEDDIKQESTEDEIKTSDETTPLLQDLKKDSTSSTPRQSSLYLAAKRLVDALTESLKSVLSVLSLPGVYLVHCFYDEQGLFSPVLPIRKLRKWSARGNSGSGSTAHAVGLSGSSGKPRSKYEGEAQRRKPASTARRRSERPINSAASVTSESELDSALSRNSSAAEDSTPNRRSIRIKLKNEDSLRQRKGIRSALNPDSSSPAGETALTTAIKSPTSPAASLRLTKYPRAPTPPRPLVPRRQPSYSNLSSPRALPQKTLVIDLDETLIHSLAKGGRMSSGHMVEVKLNSTYTSTPTSGGPPTTMHIGPQHPILYYVHKRPHCDEFLKKICKWYNLVVFTASVQEYADPVIDWLEMERQYFSARYYRQHCTLRNGAYIKDLSSVEPDLSRVMILDNSPLSYIFHEGPLNCHRMIAVDGLQLTSQNFSSDNAIPIEGWINDPTDNDLLHLIPMLEALQYVTDVRALLALRRGEAEAAIS